MSPTSVASVCKWSILNRKARSGVPESPALNLSTTRKEGLSETGETIVITLKTSGEEEDEGGSFLYYRLSRDESWADEGRECFFSMLPDCWQ